MLTLVFAHSPLIPAWTWSAVADLAARAGYGVRLPNLGEVAADPLKSHLPLMPRCAEALAQAARGSGDPVLIAHSAAGLLMPQAATSMYRPSAILFVDSPLPQPGKSWFDMAPPEYAQRLRAYALDRMVPRWPDWYPPDVMRALLPDRAQRERFIADCPRLPRAFFEEPAPHAELPDVPCAYLRLSQSYETEARAAQEMDWTVRRASLDHLAMITQPNLVAGMLFEALQALPAPAAA